VHDGLSPTAICSHLEEEMEIRGANQEGNMTTISVLRSGTVALGVAAWFTVSPIPGRSHPLAAPAPTVGPSHAPGVVSGPSGPEAGVWVIAETSDLATRFVKIVVTDDQGRYLL